MLSRRIILYSLLIIHSLPALTQSTDRNAYTVANGLPNDHITCMLQDARGFLWVGTFNGLSRFDGTHFYSFRQGLLQSNQIAGDLILDMQEEGHHMWIGHRFGLSKINKNNLNCENFQPPDTGSTYTLLRAVRDIWLDKQGELWLAGIHLFKFDRKTNTIIKMVDLAKLLPRKALQYINKIVPEGDDRLLLLTSHGWVTYNKLENKLDTSLRREIPIAAIRGENLLLMSHWNTFASNYFVFYDTEKASLSITNNSGPEGSVKQVRNIYVDDNLDVFMNTEPGQTIAWMKDNRVLNSYFTGPGYRNQELTQFNYGYNIGNLPVWGRKDGLYISDGSMDYSRKYFFSRIVDEMYRKAAEIRDVTEFDANRWLIGTKKGLYFMDKTSNTIQAVPLWNDSFIHKLVVLPDQSVWLSTENHLYHYNMSSNKVETQHYLATYATALQYFNGKLLVATRSDGILLIDPRIPFSKTIKMADAVKQLSSNRITDVKKYGGPGDFIVTYNELGGYSYNNFETGYYSPQTIPATASVFGEQFAVTAVLPVKKQLWLGEYTGGVTMFDSLTGKWVNFTNQSGLSSNYISEILADRRGRIWIITNEGIDIYDHSKKLISKFPLRMQPGGRLGGFFSNNGKMVFFDKAGIVEVEAERFNTIADDKKILFSQIIQDKDQLPLLSNKNTVRLPYDKNSLSIIFSLLKFDPEQVTRYSYRLNENESWTDIGTETKLSFASLEPGKYNLQIRATDEFGQWSHYSDELSIYIRPPFWRTAWFWIICLLATAFLLWRIYKYRLRQLKKVYELRQKISRDFHDELGATLSGIKVFSELARDRPETGQLYLDKINNYSDEMLNKMSDIVWTINPENDSFERIIAKLHSYAASMTAAKNIQLYFTVDESLKKRTLDMNLRKNIYLIIKEAINNSIKYAGGNNLKISLASEHRNGVLSITDDGKGFIVQRSYDGNGLINMQRRAEEIKGKLIISSEPMVGTSIKLYFNV